MGGGRPKVESPKPGPYEKRLAKEMEMLWPYKQALLQSYAWALPGVSGGISVPSAPVGSTSAPLSSTLSSSGGITSSLPSQLQTPTAPTPVAWKGLWKAHAEEWWKQLLDEMKGRPPWEIQQEIQRIESERRAREGWIGPVASTKEEFRLQALKHLYEQAKKGWQVPTQVPTAPVSSAPSISPAPSTFSPTRPPTYMLAPYMEAIEKEYSKAREAISGMRPGGAKERAMLELEAYWKPQAKATAVRALYEEARAGIAGLVGEYTPALRTLVGLEQQKGAMEYQQRAAAAQAAAAQQASMWQALGGLASLGMMALFF